MKSYLRISYNIKKLIIVSICLLLMLLMAACSSKVPSWDIESGEEPEAEFSEWAYDGGSYTAAKERSELVTAHADASGRVDDIDVAVKLSGIEGDSGGSTEAGTVRDKSDLKEISNKNGDEEFEQKDGYIYFQNLGRDISYEGKGEAELPVSVGIKYYLDDEEKSASEIKGSKGHVKVEYSLSYNANSSEGGGGVCEGVHIPFVAVTMVMLEGEDYSNVEVKDCKLSSVQSEDVILGLTMPGMDENLRTLSMDDIDIDIPEEFSFEMDTDNFELGFSTTIVTTDLLDEDIDLSDLDSLKSSLGKLQNAGKKIANAGDDVEDGMSKFRNGLAKYLSGVKGLNKSIGQLKSGAKTLDENSGAIIDGAKTISEGTSGVDTGFDDLKALAESMLEEDPDNPDLRNLVDGMAVMSDQLKLLDASGQEYADAVKAYCKGVGDIKRGAKAIKKGSAALAGQGDKVLEGYDTLSDGVSDYTDAICKFYSDGIRKLTKKSRGKINTIETFIQSMETADNWYKSYSGCEKGIKNKVTFIIETDKI